MLSLFYIDLDTFNEKVPELKRINIILIKR